MDAFAEDGFSGATISEVSGVSGLAVRTGSLYRHFPSNKVLLQAAVEQEVTRLRRRWRKPARHFPEWQTRPKDPRTGGSVRLTRGNRPSIGSAYSAICRRPRTQGTTTVLTLRSRGSCAR